MSIEDGCSEIADRMSCDAMIGLAKKEAGENFKGMLYLVDDPSCERFRSAQDSQMEHKLQLDPTFAISRKLCVTKTPAYGLGAWTQLFDHRVQANFNQWTKSK
jgi:hypothetical protein